MRYFIKIIDFGLAREADKTMTPEVVSIWYRAPELLINDGCYDKASRHD